MYGGINRRNRGRPARQNIEYRASTRFEMKAAISALKIFASGIKEE